MEFIVKKESKWKKVFKGISYLLYGFAVFQVMYFVYTGLFLSYITSLIVLSDHGIDITVVVHKLMISLLLTIFSSLYLIVIGIIRTWRNKK